MKITFGMIVFNAITNLPKDMLVSCVLNLYDVAHEILIVEGATKASTHYFDGDTTKFTDDGKSTDDTIEVLRNIPDPLNKIKIIESNGFWNGKTEMCNAWAEIATGDYIWQIDSDEFYHQSDIIKMKNILETEKPDAVYFNAYHFFGGFEHCIDERSYPEWASGPWFRLFRNEPGNSRWISHEPPVYSCGSTICNQAHLLDQHFTKSQDIKMYHYSYVTYEQIEFKSDFFRNQYYKEAWESFKNNKDFKPFNSTVYKFEGEHPEIIKKTYNL